MNSEILAKIDEIIAILESSHDIEKINELKEKIYSNQNLMDKVKKVREENIYGEKYIDIKKEILSDKDFSEYKELEKELYSLIQEINMKLKSLIKE